MFGAYQAGVWKALSGKFAPDIVVGASIGAFNGWYVASGAGADPGACRGGSPHDAATIPIAKTTPMTRVASRVMHPPGCHAGKAGRGGRQTGQGTETGAVTPEAALTVQSPVATRTMSYDTSSPHAQSHRSPTSV